MAMPNTDKVQGIIVSTTVNFTFLFACVLFSCSSSLYRTTTAHLKFHSCVCKTYFIKSKLTKTYKKRKTSKLFFSLCVQCMNLDYGVKMIFMTVTRRHYLGRYFLKSLIQQFFRWELATYRANS